MSGDALPIAEPALRAVYAHARRCYPSECCGFLLGPRDAPGCDEARPCENVQDALHAQDPARFPRTSREAYQLGAKDLLLLARSLDGPRPVKIVYHSHADVGAYFSDEDRRAALLADEPAYPADYLVVDAQAGRIDGAKLFCWDPAARTFRERAVLPALPGVGVNG